MSPFNPAPWQVVLVIAALLAVSAGVAAWRAGDSWRNWSVVIAFAAFVIPWLRWGFETDGLDGMLAGYLLALIFAWQNAIAIAGLILMVGALRDRNYVRIATRTQSAMIAQYLIIASAVAAWQAAAWSAGLLALALAVDLVFRPSGWWERSGVPWLERHDGVSVAIGTLVITAYPVLFVSMLHAGPPVLHHIADGTLAAIPVDTLSAEWLFLGWFAFWVIPFGIAVGLKGRNETRQAFGAAVPFSVWALLAFLLQPSARGFVTFGLVLSALFGIATWVGVVLRSKGLEAAPDERSWVPEGGAMVYVGPTDKRS